MGLSADPKAFGPVPGKADPRAAGNEAGTSGGRTLGQLDPLVAALEKALQRSAQGRHRETDSGATG